MPAPRRSRRKNGDDGALEWQPVQWPLLKEQQRLEQAIDPAEIEQAQARAQVLIEQGWGPLSDWFFGPLSPAERQAMQRAKQGGQGKQQDLAF